MPARRVVSLVPSWTETVFELGCGESLVGCTRYCVEPAERLGSVARVGGTKNPDREAVAGLEPDLVLVNTEENRADDIEWLRGRFPVHEAMPRTVADAADLVRDLGARLGAETRAAELVAAIDDAARRGEGRARGGTVGVLYVIWPKPWMSIGPDTYVHDLLARAGAANVCADAGERYPELAPDSLPALPADVVLLPDEPWVFTPEQRDELARTRTFGDRRLLLCSGKDFCWHGARTARGLAAAVDLVARHRPTA